MIYWILGLVGIAIVMGLVIIVIGFNQFMREN
jgi:hypothetical protein